MWSQKLFGDASHKSEMQSIIDKLQSQQTLDKLVKLFYDKLTAMLATFQQQQQQQQHNNTQQYYWYCFAIEMSRMFGEVRGDFDYVASLHAEATATSSANVAKSLAAAAAASSSSSSSSRMCHALRTPSAATDGGGSDGCDLLLDANANDDDDDADDDFDDLSDDDVSSPLAAKLKQQHHQQQQQRHHMRLAKQAQQQQLLQQQQQQQQQQSPPIKVVWSLLIDCLRRCIRILSAHVEFSSRLNAITTSMSATATAAAAASFVNGVGRPMVAPPGLHQLPPPTTSSIQLRQAQTTVPSRQPHQNQKQLAAHAVKPISQSARFSGAEKLNPSSLVSSNYVAGAKRDLNNNNNNNQSMPYYNPSQIASSSSAYSSFDAFEPHAPLTPLSTADSTGARLLLSPDANATTAWTPTSSSSLLSPFAQHYQQQQQQQQQRSSHNSSPALSMSSVSPSPSTWFAPNASAASLGFIMNSVYAQPSQETTAHFQVCMQFKHFVVSFE